MTIPNSNKVDRSAGDGATAAFAYNFYIQDDDDIEVTIYNSSTNAETTLTKTTHYTVSGAGSTSGGTVTLLSPYDALSSSYTITRKLKPSQNNQSSFRNGGPISASGVEDALDVMSQRVLDLQEQVDRCLKLPKKETPTSSSTVLPESADRASKYLTTDASGNLSTTSSISTGSVTVSSFAETFLDDTSGANVMTTLGITATGQSILDDASTGAVLTTLGITAAAQTVLDDTTVGAMRTTLGLDGASGVLAALDLADAATAQIFQARLTLTSATAVTTSDVTGAGTIYLTPYKGNKIAVYTGTRWKLMALTEISLALTATSGKPYDVWVYDNSGTLTLETTVWTNDTTRATALALQDGVYCKTGSLTRRYIGSFYATGSNQTEDSLLKRCVWNYYNRVRRALRVYESTNSWTYTTAAVQQANNSSSNQIEFIRGVNEDDVEVTLCASSANSTAGVYRAIGVGESVGATSGLFVGVSGAANDRVPMVAHYSSLGALAAGRKILYWNEYSAATGTTTWYGDDTAGPRPQSSGMHGFVVG